MKRFGVFGIFASFFVLVSCDPNKAIGGQGEDKFYISVENNYGHPILEKDNWGAINSDGSLSPSERVIPCSFPTYIWASVPKIPAFENFISLLREKEPEAFVEIYEYDENKQIQGRLLKRWELQGPEINHDFFDGESFTRSYVPGPVDLESKIEYKFIFSLEDINDL